MKKTTIPLAFMAMLLGNTAMAQAINFSQIDTNGDHILQKNELVAAFGEAGAAAVAALDTDNDGEVSLAEASSKDRADNRSERGNAASEARGDNRSERGNAASEARGDNRSERGNAASGARGDNRSDGGNAASEARGDNRSDGGNAASSAKDGNRG